MGRRNKKLSKINSERVGPKNPMYGKRGSEAAHWKGGVTKETTNHRISVHRYGHPHANKRGYILGYRLKMEKRIGRYLRPEEVIHHIDGNCTNDTQENLMLFKNESEHQKWHNRACKDPNIANKYPYLSIKA